MVCWCCCCCFCVNWRRFLFGLVLVRFGPVPFRSVPLGSARFRSVRFGSVWFGSVRFGSVRFGSVRFGSVRFGSVRFVLVRFVLVWFGLVWFGLVWSNDELFLSPRLCARDATTPCRKHASAPHTPRRKSLLSVDDRSVNSSFFLINPVFFFPSSSLRRARAILLLLFCVCVCFFAFYQAQRSTPVDPTTPGGSWKSKPRESSTSPRCEL